MTTIQAEEQRWGRYERIQVPIGVLEYRLGSLITIEGVRAEKGLVGTQTLIVDTIEGLKLAEPVSIWIDNIDSLPSNSRIKLKGYESGRWIGTPPEIAKAYPDRTTTQAAWQFAHIFLVTDIVSPSSITFKNKKS